MTESNNKNNQSFAERFAKKKSFTSSKLEDVGSKTSDIAESAILQSKNAKLPIDMKKRAMAELIYLVHGDDNGRNAWYYILVDRLKVQMFLKAMKSPTINLDDYGKVLYSAYGDNPPESVTQKLKDEYGIEG